MPAYDFRDQPPVWVWYGTYVGPNPTNKSGWSEKYIEARVDLADDGAWVFSKRFGALPDNGRGTPQPKVFQSMEGAQRAARLWITEKQNTTGYTETPRPRAADSGVLTEPDWDDEDD